MESKGSSHRAGAKAEAVTSRSQVKRLFGQLLGKHKQLTSYWERSGEGNKRIFLKLAVHRSVPKMFCVATGLHPQFQELNPSPHSIPTPMRIKKTKQRIC